MNPTDEASAQAGADSGLLTGGGHEIDTDHTLPTHSTPISGSTSDSPGVLSRLPPEILVQVLADLAQADLGACLRVNSDLCSLALPLLYAHVKLGEAGPWPVFDTASASSSPASSRPTSRDASRASSPQPPAWTPRTRPAFLARAALVAHIQHLDIAAHPTTTCASSGLLHWWHGIPPCPRLRVVRLSLSATWSGNRVFHTNTQPRDPDPQPERICAALAHVRAPMLVVRRLTLAHATVPRHELPAAFEDAVRHFVAVFQPDHPYFLPRNAEHSARQHGMLFRNRLPRHASRITLVFWPPGRTHAWRAGPGAQSLSWELIWAQATSLLGNLATWAAQRGAAVEIVNVGALQRIDDGSELSEQMTTTMHEAVRELFVAAAHEWFPAEQEQERFMRSVSVLGMPEWLAQPGWEDVFDDSEVAPWRSGELDDSEVAPWRSDATAETTAYQPPESDDCPSFAPLHTPAGASANIQHLPLFQLAVTEV